jgi:hypothetical protein
MSDARAPMPGFVGVECGHRSEAAENCPQCPREALLPAGHPDTVALQTRSRSGVSSPMMLGAGLTVLALSAGSAAVGMLDWSMFFLFACPSLASLASLYGRFRATRARRVIQADG